MNFYEFNLIVEGTEASRAQLEELDQKAEAGDPAAMQQILQVAGALMQAGDDLGRSYYNKWNRRRLNGSVA